MKTDSNILLKVKDSYESFKEKKQINKIFTQFHYLIGSPKSPKRPNLTRDLFRTPASILDGRFCINRLRLLTFNYRLKLSILGACENQGYTSK